MFLQTFVGGHLGRTKWFYCKAPTFEILLLLLKKNKTIALNVQLHYFTEFNAKSIIISLILMCSLQIESLLEVSLQRRNNYANGMQFKLDNSITKLQAVASRFKSITSMLKHPVMQAIIRSTTIYVLRTIVFTPILSSYYRGGNKSNLGVIYYRQYFRLV